MSKLYNHLFKETDNCNKPVLQISFENEKFHISRIDDPVTKFSFVNLQDFFVELGKMPPSLETIINNTEFDLAPFFHSDLVKSKSEIKELNMKIDEYINENERVQVEILPKVRKFREVSRWMEDSIENVPSKLEYFFNDIEYRKLHSNLNPLRENLKVSFSKIVNDAIESSLIVASFSTTAISSSINTILTRSPDEDSKKWAMDGTTSYSLIIKAIKREDDIITKLKQFFPELIAEFESAQIEKFNLNNVLEKSSLAIQMRTFLESFQGKMYKRGQSSNKAKNQKWRIMSDNLCSQPVGSLTHQNLTSSERIQKDLREKLTHVGKKLAQGNNYDLIAIYNDYLNHVNDILNSIK